ncbi:long-chain acyl-CoA synthetase [Rhodococcus sp. 27YEA15]|uniref:AMP-dependent synthetase/ligase n=1 Tax=Rhodococcus sp. 27YEA15 TaxID=3156259 RepID=UPI003C7C5336
MNRISSTGDGIFLDEHAGLYSIVADAATRHPQRPSVGAGVSGPVWTCAELDAGALALASKFLGLGMQAGDRLAVLGRTSLDWVLIDLAALAIGVVIVPVYPTSSDSQIAHIVGDSGAVFFAAETAEDAVRLRRAGAADVLCFADISGWSSTGEHPELGDRVAAVRQADTAMIVYTSGTTGPAKGCVLTHGNVYASSANTVLQTGDLFGGGSGAQAVTVHALPLSHVFGQTILFACLFGGSRTHLLGSMPELVPALAEIAPTFLALVPYALEKIRKAAPALSGAKGVAVQDDADSSMFGGRLRNVISGGASLDDTTVDFFADRGVRILNCYGMTETATAATVNRVQDNKLGSVGRPIPGTSVGIADDGEVLIRGANVSPGYWGAAADRSAVDSDGWLHSGDIGQLDTDGFLRITGRKKEILVTAGGKNVAPTPLEDRLRLHPVVSNCMVLGDGRSFVAALVTLDASAHARWLQTHSSADAGPTSPELLAELQSAVDDANSLVSRAESIRAFRVVDGDFTTRDGLLTSSLKLRRRVIEDTYRSVVEDMYSDRV